MMASFLIFVILCLVGSLLAAVTSQIEKDYFTAAIFEHVRLGNTTTDTPAEIVAMNLDYYNRAAETASSKGADIIAFPEYGFFPFMDSREDMRKYLETIPDHKIAKWNPCQQAKEFRQRPILRRLSCIAKSKQIVVVTAMGDIQPCNKQQHINCPDDGFWHHNGIVAFDRDGTLIGVSRKEHLFFEVSMDLPPAAQDPFFTTDFGTFAMYVCFDSVFKDMALVLRNASIDAVILSPMWVDYRPLLTPVQFFSSLAFGSGGNLLAPNVKIPGSIPIGSGVYAGKMGVFKYTFNNDNQSKVVVSRLPKNRNQDRNTFRNEEASIIVITGNGSEQYNVNEEEEGNNIPDVCYLKAPGQDLKPRCLQEPTTNHTFVKLTGSNGTVEACNNGLCCRANYEALSMNESFYLGVLNGTHNEFDRYIWCTEVCFVVRCDHSNGSVCNNFLAHSQTVFRRLELCMNTTTDFVYPSVLKSGYRLSPGDEWSFSVEEESGSYHGRLIYESDSDKPLVNVAMTGRCYNRDPPYIR